MKLLVNLSVLGPKPTGLGVYGNRCAKAAGEAFETEVIAPGTYAGPGVVVKTSPGDIVLGAGKLAPVRRWWWARGYTQPKDRLLYSPTHHGFAHGQQQILTVHDLTSIRLPKNYPLQSFYFKNILPKQLTACRAVFTVSETSRLDIHEEYGVPLGNIHVVPNGVDTTLFKPASEVRKNFLLVVGASYSHKNVQEIIERANLWKDKYSLVIVSSRGKYREFLGQAVEAAGISDKVQFIPYAEMSQLVALYQTCAAFVYPSKWEGFGIPPLEAMACGAHVIVSDIPVHREVLGSAATFVKLGDETSWTSAIAGIPATGVPTVVAPAAAPIQKYTWDNAARALVSALLKVDPKLERRHVGLSNTPAERQPAVVSA